MDRPVDSVWIGQIIVRDVKRDKPLCFYHRILILTYFNNA